MNLTGCHASPDHNDPQVMISASDMADTDLPTDLNAGVGEP